MPTFAVPFALAALLVIASSILNAITFYTVFQVPISVEATALFAVVLVFLPALMYVYILRLAVAYAILFAVACAVLLDAAILTRWKRESRDVATYQPREYIIPKPREEAPQSIPKTKEVPQVLMSGSGRSVDLFVSERRREIDEIIRSLTMNYSARSNRANRPFLIGPQGGGSSKRRLLPSDQAEFRKFPQKLRNALLLMPRDEFKLIEPHDQLLANQVKRQIEYVTGYAWNWWPFAPLEQPLEAGHIRVKWDLKGFSGAIDLVQPDTQPLLELLRRLPSHPAECLCCRTEKIKVTWKSLGKRVGDRFTKTLSRLILPITSLSLNAKNRPMLYKRKVKHGLVFTSFIIFSIMAMMIVGCVLSTALGIVRQRLEPSALTHVYIHTAITFSTNLVSVGNITLIYFPSFVVMQLVGIYTYEMYFWITKPANQGAQGDPNQSENVSSIDHRTQAHTLLSIATTPGSSDAASSVLPSDNQRIENDLTSDLISEAVDSLRRSKWVLFGVSGVSRYPTLDQIPVVQTSTDKSFFCDLMHSYRSQRGWFALCFSPFTLANCRSVEFLLMNIGCLISIAGRLPEGLECSKEYCYHPRPPTAHLPLVSKDEFSFYLSICPENCIRRVWVPWHTCTILASGIQQRDERLLRPESNQALPVLTRLPKKRTKYLEWSLYTINKPAYGIETEYEVSLMAVTVYHILLILPSFGFWAYWLYYHPGDLQNASVPLLTTLGLIGSTWAALSFTKK